MWPRALRILFVVAAVCLAYDVAKGKAGAGIVATIVVTAFYADVLKKVSETPEWKAYVAKTSQTGRFMAGKELASFIENDASSATQVFKAEGWTSK